MSAVATAACLHLAGGDKDFSATSPSLDFPDNWGTDTVMAVRPAAAAAALLLGCRLVSLAAAAGRVLFVCRVGSDD